MATILENMHYYRQAVRESLAAMITNIHYYRIACQTQLTLLATFIKNSLLALAEKINQTYHAIVRFLRPLPAWFFSHLVQGLRELFNGIYEAANNLFIIAKALPRLSWQLLLHTCRFLKSALQLSYQLLSQLGRSVINTAVNLFFALARNFIPALRGTWQLFIRICRNTLSEIRNVPHYLYQTFIVTQEILRLVTQSFLDLMKFIVNALRPVLSFILRKTLNGLYNTIVFVLGFVAAIVDLAVDVVKGIFNHTLGRLLPLTSTTPPRSIISLENAVPKSTNPYTPSFKEHTLNRGNDETADKPVKKRPSMTV